MMTRKQTTTQSEAARASSNHGEEDRTSDEVQGHSQPEVSESVIPMMQAMQETQNRMMASFQESQKQILMALTNLGQGGQPRVTFQEDASPSSHPPRGAGEVSANGALYTGMGSVQLPHSGGLPERRVSPENLTRPHEATLPTTAQTPIMAPPMKQVPRDATPSAADDTHPINPFSQGRFPTWEEVEALFKKSQATKAYDFDLNPPYPRELANMPYPTGYEVKVFPQFDGKSGNAARHIGRFVEALGVHGPDRNIRLREFSKSLDGRAYTWYANLTPGSIRTWEDMAQLFLAKFFDGEEKVTLFDLGQVTQQPSEDLTEYVRRFRDQALECHEPISERVLVEVCIASMEQAYRVHLENLGIGGFARLLEASRKTSMSVRIMEEENGGGSEMEEL